MVSSCSRRMRRPMGQGPVSGYMKGLRGNGSKHSRQPPGGPVLPADPMGLA